MKKRITHRRKIQPGATLIEFLVGIALCIFALGCVISSIDFLHKMSVRSALDELHATCSYLRMVAFVSGAERVLTLVPDQQSYTWENHRVYLTPSVVYGTVSGALGPPSSPQNRIEKPVTFPANSIRFTPTGNIQSGSVYLVDRARHYSYALTCSVALYSYLRRYEYDGSWKPVV